MDDDVERIADDMSFGYSLTTWHSAIGGVMMMIISC
jgi:hypothetical protein